MKERKRKTCPCGEASSPKGNKQARKGLCEDQKREKKGRTRKLFFVLGVCSQFLPGSASIKIQCSKEEKMLLMGRRQVVPCCIVVNCCLNLKSKYTMRTIPYTYRYEHFRQRPLATGPCTIQIILCVRTIVRQTYLRGSRSVCFSFALRRCKSLQILREESLLLSSSTYVLVQYYYVLYSRYSILASRPPHKKA